MGQKVNPIGFRLGINRGWDSVWFAKKREYGKLLIEDYKIREYVKKNGALGCEVIRFSILIIYIFNQKKMLRSLCIEMNREPGYLFSI